MPRLIVMTIGDDTESFLTDRSYLADRYFDGLNCALALRIADPPQYPAWRCHPSVQTRFDASEMREAVSQLNDAEGEPDGVI